MSAPTAEDLRADLDEALRDLDHLRLLVNERKASADVHHPAEYRVAGLRRRLAALETAAGREGGTPSIASRAEPQDPGVVRLLSPMHRRQRCHLTGSGEP